MKKKHRKSKGELGYLTLGKGVAIYGSIGMPDKKEDLEKWVLDAALNAAKIKSGNLYNLVSNPVQNRENDFDFSLPTANGVEDLDLMEVVLCIDQGYTDLPTWYSIEEMKTKVITEILKKSRSYGRPTRPLHLLLYSTDSRLFLDKEVADRLAYSLSREQHVFSTIKYVNPNSGSSSIVLEIFPRDAKDIICFKENPMDNKFVVFGDMRNAKVQAGGAVEVPIQLPHTKIK